MKTFLLKTLVFLITCALVITSVFLLTHSIIRNKSNFKLSTPVKSVVFGHSHPSYAFNDSLIGNFKNLAQSAQSNFYTYIKARNIIQNNPSIKVVFLEFTNNQISKIMDEWTWSSESMSHKLPTYLPLMNIEEIKLLYNKNPKLFVTNTSKSFRQNLIDICFLNFDYTKNKIGGHKLLKGIDVDSLINNIDNKKNTLSDNIETYDENSKIYNKLSTINIDYLEKTIRFLKEMNIKVYLVRCPQHKKYKGLKNEETFIKIKKQKFNHIEFLDFNNFPVKNDEFADLDHLNYKGAAKFSKWFNELLRKGLLLKGNKQEFINSEINRYKH